ncbi:hypothetical protein JMX38_27890 (plasmid) [Klebsiella pneumoniae]|nr:hypothetical protein JMX38_27890 [Klebsiella pneumoniae]
MQSKGHAVGCYYCVLAEAGFFPVEWLETYQHANSHLPGHPVRQKTPGIELNTGALGHGLPVAVGLALAAKKSSSTRRSFGITGDGELAEGSNWEAAWRRRTTAWIIWSLLMIRTTSSWPGRRAQIMNTDPLADKWRAFGMEVSECQGNDMASVVSVIEGLKQEGKPNVIIANTTKGAGGFPLSSGSPGVAPPGAARRRNCTGHQEELKDE